MPTPTSLGLVVDANTDALLCHGRLAKGTMSASASRYLRCEQTPVAGATVSGSPTSCLMQCQSLSRANVPCIFLPTMGDAYLWMGWCAWLAFTGCWAAGQESQLLAIVCALPDLNSTLIFA